MTTIELLWSDRRPEPACHFQRALLHLERERYRLLRWTAVLAALTLGAIIVATWRDALIIITIVTMVGSWVGWVANQWQRIKKLEWEVSRLKEDFASMKGVPNQLIEIIAGVGQLREGQVLLRSEMGELARSVHEHHEREARGE